MTNAVVLREPEAVFDGVEARAASDAGEGDATDAARVVEAPIDKDETPPENVKGGTPLDDYVEKANAYIEATGGTGEFGEFTTPFSRQFKTSLRTYFPDDKVSFDAIDTAESMTNKTAIKMRRNTYYFYLLFSLFYVFLSVGLIPLSGGSDNLLFSSAISVISTALATVENVFGGIGFDEGGRLAPLGYFLVLAVFFVPAFWARVQVRDFFFNKIENSVSTMALRVSSELSAINQLVTNALESVDQDRTPEDEWPERAGKWTKVALWGEERYQNIDRYLTATSWRVEDRFHWFTYGFFLLNAITAALCVGGVFAFAPNLSGGGVAPTPWASLVVGAVIYLILVIGVWTIGFDRGNNFWRNELLKRFSESERGRVHMFDRIGNKMRTDKNEILRRRI